MILPVFNGCETWSVGGKKKPRLGQGADNL
jgi:hypothetical protein